MTLNELSNASVLKKKFLAADYPHKLINSVINTFTEKGNEKEEEYLILLHFFKIPKPVILRYLFVSKMRLSITKLLITKQFIKKFNYFTNYNFDVRIKWLTRKIRTLSIKR